MADTDDWQPLAPDQLAAHPGEFASVAPRDLRAEATGDPLAAVPPKAVPAAAAAPRDPAAEAAAEAALAALRAKLQAAPPPRSLLAEVRPKRRRASRVAAEPPAAAVVDAAPPALAIEYAAGADGRDPREEEGWFLALPAAEQARLRGQWGLKRELLVTDGGKQARIRRRRFGAAMVVFAGLWLLGTGAMWHVTLGAGVVTGICWGRLWPNRLRDPVVAFGCYVGVLLVAMAANAIDRLPPAMVLDSMVLVALATLVGFDGEIRRNGGFDDG
ncbi:MAG: hypothetical protein JNK49_08960 [Planctomycetes bacterium]|nr:hypothetical protein [Planctomycetota bacterium]